MKTKLMDILSNQNLSSCDKSNLILDLAEKQDAELYNTILTFLDEHNGNENVNYQSMLVYALTYYPAAPLIDKAIYWLANSTSEVANSAFHILKNMEGMSGEQTTKVQTALRNILPKADEDWRNALIQEALDLFETPCSSNCSSN